VINLRKKRSEQPKNIDYAEFLNLKRKVEEAELEKKRKEEEEEEKRLKAIALKEAEEKARAEAAQKKIPVKSDTPKSHTVEPGETLYSISNRFYVTVEELVKFNNLPNYNIKVGQVLLLSPQE
jgi:colicin import membrane protein